MKDEGIKAGTRIKDGIAFYLAGISALLIPLIINPVSGYIDLIEQKAFLYLLFVLPGLLAAAVLEAVLVWNRKRYLRGAEKSLSSSGSRFSRIRITALRIGAQHGSCLILAGMGLWPLVSSLLSPDCVSSVLGLIGWRMGSLMICTLVLSTICMASWFPLPTGPVREAGRDKRRSALCKGSTLFLAVHGLILLFALLQAAEVDLFGFLSQLDSFYSYSYLSTIGQKNAFAGYLCLLMPLFWGCFMECGQRKEEWLYGGFCLLGFLCAATADSDSIYAGFGTCLIFLLPFVLTSQRRAARAACLLMIAGGCFGAAGVLPCFSERILQMGKISAAMVSPLCAGLLFAAGILLYVFSINCMGASDGGGKAEKLLLLVAEAVILAGAVAALVYTARHFSDEWGTNRGLIWRTGWEQFLKYPLLRKMCGIGPGLLAVPYAVLRVDPGINVVSAHCEPLHILLTQGVIGLCLYIFLWGRLLAAWFRNRLWISEKGVWFLPLAAFWGCSLFCPLYPVTASLLSVFIGLFLRTAEAVD